MWGPKKNAAVNPRSSSQHPPCFTCASRGPHLLSLIRGPPMVLWLSFMRPSKNHSGAVLGISCMLLRHYDSVGLIWSAESCNVSFIDGRTLYNKRKNNKNSLSLVYEGVNFLHSRFRFLTMDVDISRHVDRYRWVKSGTSSSDDYVHHLLS